MADIFGVPNVTLTTDIYWKHQPKEVRELEHLQEPEVTTLAKKLAMQGFIIDVPCMVWRWDPALVMAMRKADGYTWVPSALMNPIVAPPGFSAGPHVPLYDPANPPPGAIIVSIDSKDYPEAPDLVAADQASAADASAVVGSFLFTDDSDGRDVYGNAAASSGPKPPTVATDARGTFDLFYTPGPFGFSVPHYKLRK